MTKKPNSEKNLWQRIPMRWRILFFIVLLLAANYFVRENFPMTPDLREGQVRESVPELTLGLAYERKDGYAPVDDGGKRIEGTVFAQLEKTGREIEIAYQVFGGNEETAENLGNGDTLVADSKNYQKENLNSGDKSVAVPKSENCVPAENPVPIVLLHGAAASSEQLLPLAQNLAKKSAQNSAFPRKIILIDLPGCGASSRELDDYSIEIAAGEVLALLDKLGIERAHVLGFGMGGGVALYMTNQTRERVASLALISSVGAQEYELLGNHIVNKIVYTFHLGGFKLAQDLFPHFGLMDRGDVNKQYARVLWDSDISDLASFLRDWNGPVFLAHGKDDLLSSFSSAEYNLKLAPQATTFFVPGGHYALLANGGNALAGEYLQFLDFAGTPNSHRAEPVPAGTPFPPVSSASGMRIIVLMLVILVCTFVAEDPTCLAAGLLVAQGLIGFMPACLACLVGIFIGDLALYLIGRILGRSIVRKAPFKWIVSEQQIDEMSERFSKNPKGLALIVSSRFIPGSRVPTFVAAGIMKLDWHKLFVLFFIAAALWTPPLIWLAESVGGSVVERFKEWHHNAAWLVIGAILALYLLTHFIIPAFTWRGRRMHVMRSRRLVRRELWPEFILRLPVICQFLWLSLMYRSFTLFTLANRGLGATGGVPAGSKFETYQKIFANNAFAGTQNLAVKTILVPAEKDVVTRHGNALRAMVEAKITFPCVVKPEIGEGGLGVMICQNPAELRAWFEVNIDSAIVQEFADGEEFEVLWTRRPTRAAGTINSVIQKDFVAIKGDGERNLEDLIWADDRSVNNGKLYEKLNFRNGMRKLAAGEKFKLATAGTRIKGAQYICRPELKTDELARVIDQLVDAMGRDVHFLVLDIRVPTKENLAAGTQMKITSVKGAGATTTEIYDSFIRTNTAYRNAWWELKFCFSVGDELRDERKIVPETSALKLLDLWSTAHSRTDAYVKIPD